MIKADYFGKQGNVDRYYWVVAQFVIANPLIIGPAVVRTTNPLNNDSRVLLKWDYVPGAIYYVVVQTVNSTPPNLQKDVVAVIGSPTTINYATDDGTIRDWYYPDPSTGGSGPSGVSSWNHRTGNVLPAAGDYDVTMVTGALSAYRQILTDGTMHGGGALISDLVLGVNPDTTLQKTYVYNSGVPIGQRSYLNLIGGAALTISVNDNPGQNWLDVVFSSKTGSGSGLVDPTVAKGDMLVRNISQVVRQPVGTDGQILIADSTQPTGIKWGTGSGTIALATAQYGDFPGFIHDLGPVGRLCLAETPTIVWFTGQNGLDAAIYPQVLPHETGTGYPGGLPSNQAQIRFERWDGQNTSANLFVPYNQCQFQIQVYAEDQLSTFRPVPQINLNAQGMLTERPNTIEIGYTDGTWTYDAIYCDLLNSRVGIGLRKFPAPGMMPAYALDVIGDCNITGVYRINGVPFTGGFADPTTTKGDLIVRGASATTRLAVGVNGQVLTVDSTQTLGVKWSTPSSGGGGGGGQTVPLIVNGTVVAQSTTEFFSDEAANAAADAIAAKLNGGTLKIYTDPRPTNVNTAITTQTLLAQPAFANPAFSAAVAGVATANPLSSVTALATGLATWFRACKSDGTAVFDGSVGLALSDLNMNQPNMTTGNPVNISSFTITQDRMRT